MSISEKIRPSFGLVEGKPEWMSGLDNIPYDKEEPLSQAAHHINDLVIAMFSGGN